MNETMYNMRRTAERADLEPGIAYKIRDFFLNQHCQQDLDDIDAWMYASYANGHLFDLLLEEKGNDNFERYMAMVIKMAKRRVNPWYRYGPAVIKWGLTVIIAILVLDFLIPSHPLSLVMFGKHSDDFKLAQTTVNSGTEGRTIWLADSTRIDLQPHSMARYSNTYNSSGRKLQISGSALVAVRGSLENPLRLEAGKYIVQTSDDALIRYEDNKLTVGKSFEEQK